MERCAGLDWAKDTHQVCVLEANGEPLLQRGFAHGERDLDRMCELLVELGVKRIAIERPEGVLVERVLEAGLVVVPIHPRPLGRASVPPAESPTPSTPSVWLSSPAPTTVGSEHSRPTRTRPRP